MGFVDQDPYMLLMEFVEKGNLADYLAKTHPKRIHTNNNASNNDEILNWTKKREITLQIAQGIFFQFSVLICIVVFSG